MRSSGRDRGGEGEEGIQELREGRATAPPSAQEEEEEEGLDEIIR